MTIVRLNSGALLLHSPVRLTEDLGKELDALGQVKYVVAPNKFHHLHVGDYVRAYPGAEFYAASGLPEKGSLTEQGRSGSTYSRALH